MKSTTLSSAPKPESIFFRILLALPLLGLFYFARTVLTANVSHYLPLLEEAAKTGWIDDKGRLIELRKTYSGIEELDSFLAIFVGFFTPALAGLDRSSFSGIKLDQWGWLYARQRLQSITFLADVTVLNAILTLESCRRGNSKTLVAIPTIFLLAGQLLGAGQISPLFYFLTYITTSPSRLNTRTNRTVPTHYAKTILPALLLGYIIPSIGSFYPSSPLSSRQGWNYIWQFFPIWIPAFHFLFSRFISNKGPGSEIASLRLAYALVFLVSTSAYLYVFSVSPGPFSQLFFKNISVWDWDTAFISISENTAMFLKWDEIFIVLGTAYWMMLNVRDLKREGRIEASWVSILAVFGVVSALCGPGAGMAVIWWWREEALSGADLEGKRE
ncbi:hypothetical protein N431DRAFT_407772 [Stipitochalara longipes BDJ]|nr:hypothetical protein N431DRAFT_407772 [Stipitochalara longipes BDJ]